MSGTMCRHGLPPPQCGSCHPMALAADALNLKAQLEAERTANKELASARERLTLENARQVATNTEQGNALSVARLELLGVQRENTRHEERWKLFVAAADRLADLLDGLVDWDAQSDEDGHARNAVQWFAEELPEGADDALQRWDFRSDNAAIRKPCPVPSSVTGASCELEEGHPADGPNRFHRYPKAADQ